MKKSAFSFTSGYPSTSLALSRTVRALSSPGSPTIIEAGNSRLRFPSRPVAFRIARRPRAETPRPGLRSRPVR